MPVVREVFYGALGAKVSHIIVKDSKIGGILLTGREIAIRNVTQFSTAKSGAVIREIR